MLCMANKKKVSGKHQTPRRAVQLPDEWVKVAKELASDRPMPVMWYLVELIQRDAEAKKKADLPPLPWKLPGK